jgi:hypothetical protein
MTKAGFMVDITDNYRRFLACQFSQSPREYWLGRRVRSPRDYFIRNA